MNSAWLVMLLSATQPPAPSASTPANPGAASATQAAWSYEPFPEIPMEPLLEDKFASWLTDTCEKLRTANVEPREAFESGLPKPGDGKNKQSPEWTAVQSRVVSAKHRIDWNSFAAAGGDAQEDVAEITQMLKNACQKMSSRPPAMLATSELAALRQARDDSRLRAVVKAWASSIGKKNLAEAAAEGASGALQSQNIAAIAPTGGLSDMLIRGMAEFLEKRAQQVALRYLRGQLKKELCDSDETKAFFKNVCAALDTLDDNASIAAIGSYLRAAAERDLRRLPDVSLAYAEWKDRALAPITLTGRVGLSFFAAAKSGRMPLEILWSIGGIEKQRCEASDCKDAAHAIRLASAVAYALRQAGEDWDKGVPLADPNAMPVHAVAVTLLAESRLVSKDPATPLFTAAKLLKVAEKPAAIASAAIAFLSKWKQLQVALKNEKLLPDQRRELILGAILDSAVAMAQWMRETVDVGDGPREVEQGSRALVTLAHVAADASERRYADATMGLTEALADSKRSSPIPPRCQKFLALILEIGSAQSSNEVAAIFDAYAAPLSTYELKYEKPMVTINGFLGVLGGWEHTNHDDQFWGTYAGAMFAPVGVHATSPVFGGSMHLGVLIGLLDLGAITSFRTSGNTTGTLSAASTSDQTKSVTVGTAPQIGFDQIFSPGAYLTVAPIRKSPFVAGLGLSLSPRLRRITQGQAVEEASALRFGFFLSFDVPVLPL
jgi:hypothetical protein